MKIKDINFYNNWAAHLNRFSKLFHLFTIIIDIVQGWRDLGTKKAEYITIGYYCSIIILNFELSFYIEK